MKPSFNSLISLGILLLGMVLTDTSSAEAQNLQSAKVVKDAKVVKITQDAPVALNRLFTTKSQRDQLNALRAQQSSAKNSDTVIQGYVKRSDGLSTWWIDQKPLRLTPEETVIHVQTR